MSVVEEGVTYAYMVLQLDTAGFLTHPGTYGTTHHKETRYHVIDEVTVFPNIDAAKARKKVTSGWRKRDDHIIACAENGVVTELLFTKEQVDNDLPARLKRYRMCYGGYGIRTLVA